MDYTKCRRGRKISHTRAAKIWIISRTVFFCLAFLGFSLAPLAETARGCGGCFRLPYRSLLERVEGGDCVVVAHASGPKGTSWTIDQVIKGNQHTGGETISGEKLDFRSRANFHGPHILIWNRAFDTWAIDAPSNRELSGFLRAVAAVSVKQVEPSSVRHQVGQIIFFLPYLEHQDNSIADSAHAKLSNAPYAVLQGLSDDLDADQLLAWIDDQPASSTKRVALSVVLLGICGGQREAEMVEKWIKQCSSGGDSAYLTALLIAHIELGGEPAVRFLEESYIRNRERTLGEVLAAIDALRTHGQANTTVSRDRIKASFQLLLRERAPLLETFIEDFARWEDWSITPRLIEIYAGGKQPWNNAMIINYLKACPLQEAKQFLQSLATDDETVQ